MFTVDGGRNGYAIKGYCFGLRKGIRNIAIKSLYSKVDASS